MIIEFLVLPQNFKSFQYVDIIKIYLFLLLGIYLNNNLIHLTMSAPDKCQRRNNE